MLKMKRAVLPLLLLPVFFLATEARAAKAGAGEARTGDTRPPASVPLPLADAECDLTTRSNAMYWYLATLCAQHHKELRPQEEKIQKLIAVTYPAFHRALTMAPYGPIGRATIDNLPFLPGDNFMLTEDSCKTNFSNMMHTIKDAKTKATIEQCWEQPAAAAKGKPFSPLDDRVCVGTAQYMASAWYRAGMCSSRHKDLAAREAKIKDQIAASYPDFQQAISTPPLAVAGKTMATYTYPHTAPDHDPALSEEACEENLDSLALALKDGDWHDAIQQCWGKPRTATTEKATASR